MNQAVWARCTSAGLRRVSLFANLLDEELGAKRFWPFDGEAKRARPDELREHAQRAGHAEHYRVVVHFLQTIILETKKVAIYISMYPKLYSVVVGKRQLNKSEGHILINSIVIYKPF